MSELINSELSYIVDGILWIHAFLLLEISGFFLPQPSQIIFVVQYFDYVNVHICIYNVSMKYET